LYAVTTDFAREMRGTALMLALGSLSELGANVVGCANDQISPLILMGGILLPEPEKLQRQRRLTVGASMFFALPYVVSWAPAAMRAASLKGGGLKKLLWPFHSDNCLSSIYCVMLELTS